MKIVRMFSLNFIICVSLISFIGLSCVTTKYSNFSVRVFDSKTKYGVKDAKVIIELKDGRVERFQAEEDGYAKVYLPQEYEGQPIRLIVQKENCDEVRRELSFTANLLSQEIMLNCSKIDPTPQKTPIIKNTPETNSAIKNTTETNSAASTPNSIESKPKITLKKYSNETGGFQFSLTDGSFDGKKLILKIMVTSKNQDKYLWINSSSRLFDDLGNVYKTSRTQLGTKEQSSGGMAYNCPADTPIMMVIEFDNIASNIRRFEMLELNHGNDFKVQYAADKIFNQPSKL